MKTKLFESARLVGQDAFDAAKAVETLFRKEQISHQLRKELKRVNSVIQEFLFVFKGPPSEVTVENSYYFHLCARRREILNTLRA